ncbi:Cysteine desulfurase IscS [Commensalibacter sp. Nvir]|uniref:cysteine desulfurase family protein n=1 Tax=Commensalibacter sp. Nvir TaxID=3069817 RepID=UPI002D4669CC|nr:Cysteine desulfurase IscS [Commensalibacter sp. Nvir]
MQNAKPLVYLDANASEPIRESAMQAIITALKVTGNPSSVHTLGRKCYHLLEDARETLVSCFGGSVQNCIFTSGGTEADVLAVHGQIHQRPLWVGATEHPAILNISHSKFVLPVNDKGVIDLAYFENALQNTPIAPLVCLMYANNETGVIHPIQKVSELCQRYGALLHVDAVQAAGRIPVNLEHLGADSIAFSAHKMGGAKGAGLLLLNSRDHNAVSVLNPLFAGGGQEQNRRGGTQGLPTIVGMAVAAKEACNNHRKDIALMRDEIEIQMKKLGAVICGEEANRLDNTSCIAFAGIPAQKQFMALDMAGFCVSTGSACSSGKISQSQVLKAMGLENLAGCALRVSLPWNIKSEDISRFIDVYRHYIKTVI